MFVYKSRFLIRGEVWFGEKPGAAGVDWIYHRQRSSPLAHCRCKDFYTRLIDLRQEPSELLADMDAKTARRIKDAEEKDGLLCERCDTRSPKVLDGVEEMWNRFAIATTDIRLLGINAFKQGFGGEVVRDYGCEQPITVKGWVGLAVAHWLSRLKPPRWRTGTQPKGKHNATETKGHTVSAAFR